MPLPEAIYRHLDFGITLSNDCEIAPSRETTENPDGVSAECSSGRKCTIEDVLPCENVESEGDTSAPVSPVKKAARRSPRLAIKSPKNLLSKRRNQFEEHSREKALEELNKSKEMQVLKELEINITHIDGSLHCELELITGHRSSAALSVYLKKEKSYREDLGNYQPVRLLFSPSGSYKFQVFIYKTLEEGTIDLKDKVAVERVLGKIQVNSGFAMCPGIVDYDAIISDIRFQPSNVKEER